MIKIWIDQNRKWIILDRPPRLFDILQFENLEIIRVVSNYFIGNDGKRSILIDEPLYFYENE